MLEKTKKILFIVGIVFLIIGILSFASFTLIFDYSPWPKIAGHLFGIASSLIGLGIILMIIGKSKL